MTQMVLSALGICCALGQTKQQVWQNAIQGSRDGMRWRTDLLQSDKAVVVGEVSAPLPDLSHWPPLYQSRNNQLAALAFQQIAAEVAVVRQQYSAQRIAVVIGTSTSGIAEGERAMQQYMQQQQYPAGYQYQIQEMLAPAEFIAQLAEVTGPCYAISTACSSSARALMSARNLLQADLADAVIVGGVDSLCQLTINGFHALESTSAGFCQPFSVNRDGINIGEGAALFVMQKGAQGIALLGAGASSDAHHMSAPHPEGRGAVLAIKQACDNAGILPIQLDYINLHGTATPLNDSMESQALAQLGLAEVPASATKSMTGHTLGAAGAIEAALCWLTLSTYNTTQNLIPHCWDEQPDPELPSLHLVAPQQRGSVQYCLSNSFAFGGNNMALILGKKI
ncbi:beta-ketoacyl-[acyl-carrier-protein] synthase family protein [Rheinheimera sp. D18]|uniref:beta-ketoacyl-[acyl-carrier-protein] synthase family protein n=1 Tax=Rheinheimera sp. D18 TaxID=2545632 RepID=UPI00104405D3|nr:beta-ketoacyl-[acyl-carrier-protein] synthase family protein [Rheinheimera sp. D18]QBL10687.1 beta-ketoacyl-[acyl-carrier-protein] synthase family protein [Rheinheimera sp. D18]